MKARSINCECEYNFTCRHCLNQVVYFGPKITPYQEPRFLKGGKRNPKWKPIITTADDFADIDAIAYGAM